MFFIPLYIGIAVGLIIVFVAFVIRKKGKPNIALIPSYLGIIVGLALFLFGYIFIRGFEGAAYIMMGIPILIAAIFSMFGKKTNYNSHQH
ncbi:YesK family protein [Niallia taxi]|uniref:YesK family protein n=1 Tax=Niallia TaxID=2837506 RepID=UPI003982B4E1